MKKILFILFLFANMVFAEAQLVQISGFVLQRADSSLAIPYASIVNKRTRSGYQSTHDGFYTILAAPGDTLEISLVGYKPTKISLPTGFSGAAYHKNIYLKDDYILLKGHTTYGITWAKFKQAFESMEVVEEKIYLTMDKSNPRSPEKSSTGVTLNGPISWLYNKLSKKAKEEEKLQELMEGDNENMEYARRITDQYVIDVTDLSKDLVKEFLNYCRSDVSFYAHASDYDIKSKFLSCLPEFKKLHNISDVVPENNFAPSDSLGTNPH